MPGDDVLDDLFRVPPGEFARARDALAARLGKAGQSSAAARVKALRVPTLPVWVINRLALEEPKRIGQLIAAAERVRAAQLGRRVEGGGLGAASAGYRDAIAALLERADRVLEAAGVRVFHRLRSRIETTLTAAVANAEARKALRKGRLERELGAQGFDVFGGALPPRRVSRRPAEPAGEPAPGQRPPAPARPSRSAREANARAEEAAAERAAMAERLETLRREVRLAARAVMQARADAKHAAEIAAKAVRVTEKQRRDAERALKAARRERPRG